MQGKLNVRCNGCEKLLTTQIFDTADVDTDWNGKIEFMKTVLLKHREECTFYGSDVLPKLSERKFN